MKNNVFANYFLLSLFLVSLSSCQLPGGPEWLVIGLIIIVLFGAKRIPQMMKGLGEGMKEFKKATKEDDTTEEDEKKDK